MPEPGQGVAGGRQKLDNSGRRVSRKLGRIEIKSRMVDFAVGLARPHNSFDGPDQIIDVAAGQVVEYMPENPTFSIKRGIRFNSRKVVATG